MNYNQNSICQYYCHSQRIPSCCCSCSISFEEILTWIVIGAAIFFLYNTIKLCIIIFLILSIIYWIYKQSDMFKKLYRTQLNSWRKNYEQNSSDHSMPDKNMNPDDDNDQCSRSLKTLLNSSNVSNTSCLRNNYYFGDLDISTISSHDFSKADNCDDVSIQPIEKSKESLNENKSSQSLTTKKSVKYFEDQDKLSSHNADLTYLISQPGYYGPIYTIMSTHSFDEDQMQGSSNIVDTPVASHKFTTDKIPNENKIFADIFEQTKGIRQMIENLQEDILQLKPNPHKEAELSAEEQTILKLATEHLIEAIMSTRTNGKSNLSSNERIHDNNYFLEQLKKHSAKELSKSQSSSSTFNPDNTDIKSKVLSVASYEIDHSMQHPKCVTVQPSFAVNSIMPRVPTKATLLAINDDEKSSQQLITTNEQFENIHTKEKRKAENNLLLKQNSIVYNNEQPDWAFLSSKPDLFANALQSYLPIAQSENQHSSFKQTFLSHFHHHPKSVPATLHSTSLNATNNILSNSNELNIHTNGNGRPFIQSSLTIEQHRIAQKLLSNKASFHYIWNKTLSHLKQGIFRVRKSRIIISFDDIQQQKDAGDNDKNNFNTLVDTVVQDISTEINHVRSQLTVDNEPQTNIANSSVVSLFQSFDSAIQEGELLMHNEKSFHHDGSENEDSSSEISSSLYSVTSQLILI